MYRQFIPYNRNSVKPKTREDARPGLKRALLIGINYVEDKRNTLYGCINDIIKMKTNLSKLYPTCTEIKSLADNDVEPLNKPTRANILAGISWLTSGLKAGDSVYLHYSGHGGLTIDRSGDEISGRDSCIYPISKKTIEIITDDELRALLVNNVPAGCKCFAVFDSCYSGSVLDLRYSYDTPEYGTITMKQNERYPSTAGSVVLLSGCTDTQGAADAYDDNKKPIGAMTNALLKVWNTYGVTIKFKYMLWDIRRNLKLNRFAQIPQLSCSTDINMNDTFKL